MTTSLAEQLQRLAVPQTSLLQDTKKRASLLFDPKEAASLRKDTVYQIGSEGLEDLILKNPLFEKFKNTLFHETSKQFERVVENKEDNKKVDKQIREFLLLLSPYFMFNSSHKTIEWLIHRYMINEFNREDILMLVLPYHETNIFVRMIQTLKFKDSKDSFYFLKNLQKPGVHLTKQSLLNHAAANSGFLKFVTGMMENLLEVHENPSSLTIAFNFYCTVFTGAIEYSSEVREDQVSQMLPLILKGLSSKISDFAASSYIITANLLAKTALKDKLLNKIMKKLSENHCTSSTVEIVLLMVVIYQSQKYEAVASAVINNIAKLPWFSQCLQYLNSNGNYIYPFYKALTRRVIEDGLDDDHRAARNLLIKLLDEVKMDSFFVDVFLRQTLDILNSTMDYTTEVLQWLQEIVQKLEIQYPSEFDMSVSSIFNSNTTKIEKKRSSCLKKILKHTTTFKGKFYIINNLYHPNEELRQQSLKYLSDNFENLKVSEKEFIKNSLHDRLNDNSAKVVKATLQLLTQTNIIQDKIDEALLTLILNKKMKQIKPQWKDILLLVIELLTEREQFDWKIFTSVFPAIIMYASDQVDVIKNIFQKPFFTNCVLFKQINQKLSKVEDSVQLTKVLILCFKDNSSHDIVANFIQAQNEMFESYMSYQYSTIFILSELVPKQCSTNTACLVLKIFKKFISRFQRNFYKFEGQLNELFEITSMGKFPFNAFKSCFNYIIEKIPLNPRNIINADFTVESEIVDIVNLILTIIFENVFNDQYRGKILGHISAEPIDQLNLLLNLACSKTLTDSLTMEMFSYIHELFQKTKNTDLCNIKIDTVAYLLTLLIHTNASIRKCSLNVIKSLVLNQTNENAMNVYFPLLKGLVEYSEEIQLDKEQTSLVTHNLLSSDTNKNKSCTSDFIKLSCETETPLYIKAGLLTVLSHINSFNIIEELCETYLVVFQNISSIKANHAIICDRLISRIDQHVAPNITLESSTWKFIAFALRNSDIVSIDNQELGLAVLILNQLTREVHSRLTMDVLKQLLEVIAEISIQNQHPEVLSLSNRLFKHLDLNANLIFSILEKMRDVESVKTDATKRKRRSSASTIDIIDTLEWKKGLSVLELIQDKKKISNSECLVPLLFGILKKCLAFQEQEPVEYPKQLILSLILLICNKVEDKLILQKAFNIELVIQCIRASQNPQTHHHASLLLVNAAQIAPTEVLHHIMTIFTFMGSSLLRYDDAYSFQIIIRIIDAVIPILLQENEINSISNVLQVFVDALLDVPQHRRIPLYKQLLIKVNEKENLYLFLLLVFEKQILPSPQEKQKQDKDQQSALDIASNLCLEFSPGIVLHSCLKLLNYLKELPDDHSNKMVLKQELPTFNIKNYTPKQFRHYKYVLLSFIKNILTTPQFINKVVLLTSKESVTLEKLYKELIVSVLTYIQKVQKVAEKASNTPQAQYWKIMLHHIYDILDSINALLTPQMFLLVIKGLTLYNITTVKRRALELLNAKLQHNFQYFNDCDKKDMYILISPIVSIIEGLNSDELETDQEILIQTALLSLKLIVKGLASEDPEKFVQILEFIANLLSTGKAQNNVLASIILCLAELCANLRVHAIPCLSDIMPVFLKVLKSQKHQDTPSLLLISVVAAVHKLLDSLSLFLSPYLKKIIFEMSILISKWGGDTSDQKLLPLLGKLNLIKQKIGTMIPARVLIPAIEESYTLLVEKRYFKAVGSLMDILSECFKNLTGTDISSNIQDLTAFFLQALKFRSEKQCSAEEANLVETQIVKSLTVLILKLSESAFRPFYYKIYDWAVRNGEKSERLITFYTLSMSIAGSLKGLFVLFASHFLNNASQILTDINKLKTDYAYFNDKAKDVLLLERVLETLQIVFQYDNQKFVNRDRFNILMQPLVDQLENDIDGVKALEKRNEKLITPTIVSFLTAVSDDVCWKQMNYQILLKMRNSSPNIRLIALHCLQEVVTKLGQDFLPLLPETIPFLAELLEDENETVEKACQKAINEMEVVLGEPLQKYF